jgi:hypothetical protein
MRAVKGNGDIGDSTNKHDKGNASNRGRSKSTARVSVDNAAPSSKKRNTSDSGDDDEADGGVKRQELEDQVSLPIENGTIAWYRYTKHYEWPVVRDFAHIFYSSHTHKRPFFNLSPFFDWCMCTKNKK